MGAKGQRTRSSSLGGGQSRLPGGGDELVKDPDGSAGMRGKTVGAEACAKAWERP